MLELRHRAIGSGGNCQQPFEDIFERQATLELSHEVAMGIQANYEEVAAFITPEFVKAYCGEDFFKRIDCMTYNPEYP